ncbi:MAG: type II secretion system protein GspG [Oligoflexia bacterium]|nr:type II secretion system protein GspG [Oligoflexia bacterium]MBF0367196.1 type II secretion system protein GspG [Oligoflexia bacterium]
MTFLKRFKKYFPQHSSVSGYTLIELTMTMLLIGILSVASISILDDSIKEGRFDATNKKLLEIKKALLGNSEIIQEGMRTHFGYLGDIGKLPSKSESLNALLTNPGVPPWSMNTTARFAHGWNGPYLSTTPDTPLDKDAWGNSLLYDVVAGKTTITSLGADGVSGGTSPLDKDITITINPEDTQSKVHGIISDGPSPYTNKATIELYTASAGALQTISTQITAADSGYFTFNSIPLGVRSLKVFIPDKTAPTKTLGPILITIDKNNFVIPHALLNLNPSGSGSGGGGGGGGSDSCPTSSGAITLIPGSVTAIGTILSFRVSIVQNITIGATKVDTAENYSWRELNFNSNRYDCIPPRVLIPSCPVADNSAATLSPSLAQAIRSNRSVIFTFSSTITTMNSATIEFTHTLGCDKFILNF